MSFNSHDARGHARQKVDGGITLAMSFDRAERLTEIGIQGGRTIKSFQYGLANVGTNRRLGRLWKATRNNHAETPWAPGTLGTIAVTEEYEYRGPDGLSSSRITRIGPDTRFAQAWSYDDLGNVTTLTYPRCTHLPCNTSGGGPFRQQSLVYTHGRLTKIPSFVDFIGHHPNGMVAHVSHTNGTVYRVDVDSSGMRRPSNIHLSIPGSAELSFGSHRYDGAGNLMVRGPEYFHYDRLSRVTRFQRGDGTNQTYGFDTFGNLGQVATFDGLSSQTRTYAINRQKNRLSGVPYDARGNLLQWGGQDYRFDEVDMLVQKEFPWETYIYTAEDERILTLRYTPQNDKLREVYSLRDLGGTLLRTYRTVGGSKGTWSWGNDFIHDSSGKTLVAVSSRPFPLRHKHYAHDHLGTPVVTTNQNGVIIGTDSLWAFGEPVDPNGSFTRKRFTGHERDYSPDGRTFDLDYMHARYYASQMGRFMSVDPIGGNPNFPQSWNRYAYGLGGPMKYTDPLGLAAVDSCVKRDDESVSCTGEISVSATKEEEETPSAHSGQSGLAGADRLIHGRMNLNALGSISSAGLSRERLSFRQRIAVALSRGKGGPCIGDPNCEILAQVGKSLEDPIFSAILGSQEAGLLLVFGSPGIGAVGEGASAAGGTISRGLFGKDALLNSNRYLRIGFGRKGGRRVFRISGQLLKRVTGRTKIDLWTGGPL